MELGQLRFFVTIAETRNFTDAALRLHVSQPALSYQIKRLENQLGARLFDRTSRHVALTLDGQVFLPLAHEVLSKADEAERVMEERLGVERGEVTFGSVPSVGAYVVPPILATFKHSFPGIKVHLQEAGTSVLERSVVDGETDFAIVSTPEMPEALEITHMLAEELLLIVPPNSALAKRSSVSMRDLATEELILLTGAFTLTQQVFEFSHRAGFEPRVAYEVGSLESMKSFVSNGLGVAIVPKLGLQGPPDESIIPLAFEERLTRDLNLIRSKGRYATVAARALMVHIRTQLVKTFTTLNEPRPFG
jgi:LysR family transcriptional regulator, cyn operon transcriptional activator